MFSNGISGCHKNGCNGCGGKDGGHGCHRQGCGGKDGCDGCHGNSIWSGRENYRGVIGCN
jgi:hypothetical protein